MIKIGKVSYLNTLPMFYNLSGYEIIQDHPSKLFNLLESNIVDIGILSSAVYLSDKEKYAFVEDLSISGRRMVCSVLLFLKKAYIKNVYLTEASITSRVLTKWYIEHILNLKPHYTTDPNQADTILYIGDKALKERKTDGYINIIDLGEEWYKAYSKSFVFALLTYKKENKNSKYFDELKNDIKHSIDSFYKKLKNDELEEHIYNQYDFVSKSFFKTYFLDCLDLSLQREHIASLDIFESFVKRFGIDT